MPSPGLPRPPPEPSPAAVTTTTTSTKVTIPGLTFQPTGLPYSATAEPVPVREVTPPAPEENESTPPAKTAAEGSDSEAETVIVLPDPSASVGSGTKEVEGKDDERKHRRELQGSPLKRRRRRSGERRGRAGEVSGDDVYSSDLSSAPGSSHPVSPRLRRRRTSDPHSNPASNPLLPPRETRKRKAPETISSSEDESPAHRPHHELSPHTRVRRRRNSPSDPSPRRSGLKSPPALEHSPSQGTRGRSAQMGHALPSSGKLRKVPPPLLTSRTRHSDEDHSSSRSSSPSSRRGSPSEISRLHRPQSATRTPGSPVSMSHKPKRDTAGRTHLHRAASRGAVDEVTSILEQSTDILNAEDNAGYMPLHEACLYGHLDVVKVLVKYGAWRDVPSRVDLETPLLDAVENGHTDVIAYLLELGCDPLRRDKLGRNCLEANTENGDLAIREEINDMLKNAINKQRTQRHSDDENPRGSVPAADRDSHSSRDPSVARSPTHNSPPAPSAPVKHSRRRNARTEQSRKDLLWLDSGKSPISKLREKAREGDFQMVHALLETGLKPDTETLCGAIKGGHTELVSLLLAYEAQVDPVPGQGTRESSRRSRDVSLPVGEETPMLAAIGRGNVTVLRYLLDNGCDPRRLDSKGKTYIEIAREREGEHWEEEVDMLREAWTKAGGRATVPKRSPQARRKLSPKTKTSDSPRRNSTSSKQPTRQGLSRLQNEKGTKRSQSANPSHGGDDGVAVSDRESTAEPLGPPKAKTHRQKRSESDSLASTIAKKRRRLVSGRELAEEEEALSRGGGGADVPKSELDSDAGQRQSDKVQPKRLRQESESAKVEPQSRTRRPKTEPADAEMKDASPLERIPPKPKADRERSHPVIKSEASTKEVAKEAKKPMPAKRERTRSPPRAPRADRERQAEQEREQLRKKKRLDNTPPRRDPKPDGDVSRKSSRDERHPEVARRSSDDVSEPPRRKEEPERRIASGEEVIKKLRQQQEAERKAKQREKQREEQLARERKAAADAQKREKPASDVKEGRNSPPTVPKRETERIKALTNELASIQQKAAVQAKKAREDEIIERELELRRQRDEQQTKERIIREEVEKEQEIRDEVFQALEAVAEEERLEREKQEQEAREKAEREQAERERIERETREREAREQEERERIAREKAEKERQEQEALEREREAERIRLEEERKREEERLEKERNRKEEEELQARLAEERRQKEEEEKRRQEEEKRRLAEIERKREEEVRRRRIAEELQAQLAAEQRKQREEAEKAEREKAEREKARIDALPYTLRKTAYNLMKGQEPESFDHFIPFFSASIPRALSNGPLTNGNSHVKREKWVLDVQLSLALGTSDLSFSDYPQIERQPASDHERFRMWSVLGPLLCESLTIHTSKTMEETKASIQAEKEKFLNMPTVFWLKYDDVMNVIKTNPKYERLAEHSRMQYTIEVKVDSTPTFKNGSMGSPSREELTQRFKKRCSLPQPLTPSHSPPSKASYSSIMPPPPPHFGNNHHSSD